MAWYFIVKHRDDFECAFNPYMKRMSIFSGTRTVPCKKKNGGYVI